MQRERSRLSAWSVRVVTLVMRYPAKAATEVNTLSLSPTILFIQGRNLLSSLVDSGRPHTCGKVRVGIGEAVLLDAPVTKHLCR